ncbi:hypothetical protein IWW38_003614, partial [Coemansia aciculifera]
MDNAHDAVGRPIRTQQILLSDAQAPNKDVTTATTKWENFRSHYSPKHSEFAPLASAATDGDDYDIAFSQAATMTAHAIELLQDVIDLQNDDERFVQQASDLLTTLCDTLIKTRDEHR